MCFASFSVKWAIQTLNILDEQEGVTEVWHIAHFWVSHGRCTMPGLPIVWSEGLSW